MKSEVDSEMFPPTQAALDFRIIRSSFVSKNGRNADKAVPFITDPEKFEWNMKDNVYEAVLSDLPPVHDIDVRFL